ncbi:MAG: response regulator [Planctomycetes bacterium]|nr:response regulator [Planctomycetota bacterium]
MLLQHPNAETIWIANASAWAITGLALGLVLWQLWHIQRRPFVRYWSISWLCFTVAHCASGLVTPALLNLPPTSMARTALSALSQIGFYLQAALLLLGTHMLHGGRTLSRRHQQLLLGLLAVIGTAIAVGTASDAVAREQRMLWRVGLRCLITGLAFVVAGVLLLRDARGRSIGRGLAAVSMAIYGLLLLSYFGYFGTAWWYELTAGYVNYTGSIDTLVQCLIGLGLVIWALEQQRDETIAQGKTLAERTLELAQSQKMEAIGRLAGGVAHDFNNLLTVIVANAESLLQRPWLDREGQDTVQEMRQAALHAAKLTSQLLTLSRNRPGGAKVQDLNRAVTEIGQMLRRLIGENVRLQSQLAPAPCRIELVRGQLEQVLLNLIVNARDAIPGQGAIAITTELVDGPPRRVRLAVHDDGMGMTDEVRAHAFEPFFTTRPGQGNGLGLASVYGIVQQSGGTVGIDSAPGRGTTITIEWPEATGPTDDNDSGTTTPPRAETGTTVLLAEDDPMVRAVTQRTLLTAGYTVLVAADTAATIELARLHPGPIHVLLTDIVMPGHSGPELAVEIRRLRPDTEILFMSGYVDAGSQRLIPDDTPLLAKPFTRQDLLTFLQRHSRHARVTPS